MMVPATYEIYYVDTQFYLELCTGIKKRANISYRKTNRRWSVDFIKSMLDIEILADSQH